MDTWLEEMLDSIEPDINRLRQLMLLGYRERAKADECPGSSALQITVTLVDMIGLNPVARTGQRIS